MTNPSPPARDKGKQRELFASIALVGGVALALWAGHAVLQDMGDRAASGQVDQAMQFVRNLMLVAATVSIGMMLLLARLLLRIARATEAQQRFPPEGLPRWLEAEPRRGVASLYLARRLVFAARGCVAMALVAAVIAGWMMLRYF